MKPSTSSDESYKSCARENREIMKKCNYCDITHVKASRLRRHLKTHLGEKSFKCNSCDFASARADNLRTHLKTHSGEKSFKCHLCDYASVKAGNLRTHLKTHSGGKSFKCHLCDFASVKAINLRTHICIYASPLRKEGILKCTLEEGPINATNLRVYEQQMNWGNNYREIL